MTFAQLECFNRIELRSHETRSPSYRSKTSNHGRITEAATIRQGSSSILMSVIVDTNRPVVANRLSSQASPKCAINCLRPLREIQQFEKCGIVKLRTTYEHSINVKTLFPDATPSVKVNVQEMQHFFLNILSNARYALNQRYSRQHPKKRIEIISETSYTFPQPLIIRENLRSERGTQPIQETREVDVLTILTKQRKCETDEQYSI